MKRLLLSVSLAAVAALVACNDITEPASGLVAAKSAPANTLVPDITITDLGTLPRHNNSFAAAINELGQVVGTSYDADFSSGRAFLWQNGAMTDLGTLPGAVGSRADALNDLGQVVGRSNFDLGFQSVHAFMSQNGVMTDVATLSTPSTGDNFFALRVNNVGQVVGTRTLEGDFGNTANRAFIWQNSTLTELGTLGGAHSFAFAVNDAGQVAGMSSTVDDFGHAFLWQNETMTDLGTLPGGSSSSASLVNDLGQVVGFSETEDPDQLILIHAFLWRNGSMTDLGTLGGTNVHAYGMNDLGQIVGVSTTAGDAEAHAFLWQIGIMTDLGTLGGSFSEADAVNNLGQVVGLSRTAGDAEMHAFVWQNGIMTDLGTLGGDIVGSGPSALAINDRGEIVGTSTTGSSAQHGVLWNTLRPATPAEEVSILTNTVNALCTDGTLNRGQCQSLLSKLNAASSQIARGNLKAAANVLEAFIKHVQNQVAAGLYSAATGQTLLDAARAAINQLSGSA